MNAWINSAWRTLRAGVATGLMLALAACGGGGGSSGEPIVGGGGGGGGSGGGGTTTPPATVTVTLSSTTVTSASPATVKVLVRNRAGVPLRGLVVTFSTTLKLGSFSAPSALTNDNGEASVQLQPATASATGADTVVATTTVDATEVTGSTGFQLTATNVSITSFTADTTTLSAYGQTGLTLQLGGTGSNPVSIVATSTCVANGKATLTPATTTTTTGRVSFTYRDNGCGAVAATDPVQVSVTGTTLTAAVNLTLTSPAVSSITFVSSSPGTIFLKGSGYVENSNIKFRVNDANGNGVPEQSVTFEPTTLAGGLLVDGVSTSVVKKTDSNGEVIVRVNAGTVPTPVRIKATLTGTVISTLSSSLSIAVGLPSQLNYSLSQGTINIEGYDYDGTANTYTVIASDRLGNPVPEGTAMNFVAEGGQIQSSALSTVVNGLSRSTANYLSAQPKPTDGRITVVAYSLGEESFLDTNGNNIYDAGEDYQDLGDIFIDRLFNFGGREKSVVYTGGSRFDPSVGYNQAEDQFVGLSLGGGAACVVPTSSLLDLRIDIPVKPSTCITGWGRAYVRRSIETILSRSMPYPTWGTALPSSHAVPSVASCPATKSLLTHYNGSDAAQPQSFYPFGTVSLYGVPKSSALSFLLADANPIAYNPMPAGSVVTVAASSGLAATVAGGSPVPSTAYPNGVSINYAFDDKTTSGTLTVTVTSPRGFGTSFSQFITMDPRPSGYVSCP